MIPFLTKKSDNHWRLNHVFFAKHYNISKEVILNEPEEAIKDYIWYYVQQQALTERVAGHMPYGQWKSAQESKYDSWAPSQREVDELLKNMGGCDVE